MQKIHVLISCLCLSLSALVGSCSQHEPVVPAGKNDFLPTDDSVYLQAQEAIYSDPLFARKLLKEAMETRPVQDSTEWYILYSLYIKTYLTTSEFDSVICVNGEAAVALAKNLTRDGIRIPEDIQIITFGGTELTATCTPKLTVMGVGGDLIGQQADPVFSRSFAFCK